MALTGNTVQSTYLDLVQLEKSGAGLPSHAGKEASLYDGSGAQILGRTAVRHRLDPDPDAISGSFEFSTMGNMTQGQLETAGWTFTNYTASVVNGVLALKKTSAYNTYAKAERSVSLSGDFDYFMYCAPIKLKQVSRTGNSVHGGLAVADSSGSFQGIALGGTASSSVARYSRASTYANPASGTLASYSVTFPIRGIRVARTGGTVYLGYYSEWSTRNSEGATIDNNGPIIATSTADASTFDKLILYDDAEGKVYQDAVVGFRFIRRYV